MRLSLTYKFVISLFLAVFCCGVVVYTSSIYFMKKPIVEVLHKEIRRMKIVIDLENEKTAKNFLQKAFLVSRNRELADAIIARDNQRTMTLGKEMMDNAASDFITVTDETGTVVGRGHSKKWQDKVLNQETVVSALRGVPAVDIVSGTEVPFTIRASYPVMRDNKVIGTVSIGASLVGPEYIDSLKKLTDMEVTAFKGDTRVMTTLMKDGRRIIGTTLKNREIANAVLHRGEERFTITDLLGTRFITAYWPLKKANGEIAGMWFIGQPLSKIMASVNDAVMTTLYVFLGILLLLLLLSVLVGIYVSRPVRKISMYVQQVRDGNSEAVLDVRGKDDMGRLAESLRVMVSKQAKLVDHARKKAEQATLKAEEAATAMEQARIHQEEAVNAKRHGMIAAATRVEEVVEKLNISIEDIATRVEQSDKSLMHAASRLTETATAMEEMNAAILEVAKNASLAADVSNTTNQKASDGSKVVLRSVESIQQVHEQSLSLKKDMATLDDKARAITQIMSVISDIADQTNLLALNAAIEAARAGEAGRGFAVVADEVRKLAEKTMASTTEVGGAIKAILDSAEISTNEVGDSVTKIAEATEYANKSGAALQEIVAMAEHTADEVRVIATASEEQSAASEEINKSIADVNDIVTTTAQAMRSAADSLESLRGRSGDLVALVEKMKTA